MNDFARSIPQLHLPWSEPGFGAAGLLRRYFLHRRICRAALPLLIVRKPVRSEYKRVLVPTDFSAGAREAARLAARAPATAQVTMLHAYGCDARAGRLHGVRQAPAAQAKRRQVHAAAMTRMDHFRNALNCDRLFLSTAVHFGAPLQVIPSYAARMQADLVVMAYPCVSGLLPHDATDILDRLLQSTHCDILLSCPPRRRPAALRYRGQALTAAER
ncbi:MAG TPA: universal stress protein [Noviherbaspirillum sp.]|jgi:nucleotide-binding universal stress UspA family protein|uniref:universal stress protein n=1 Tax=Noviherbaspirillum sp. TaxID=1926288 RepID=UPI002F9505AA